MTIYILPLFLLLVALMITGFTISWVLHQVEKLVKWAMVRR